MRESEWVLEEKDRKKVLSFIEEVIVHDYGSIDHYHALIHRTCLVPSKEEQLSAKETDFRRDVLSFSGREGYLFVELPDKGTFLATAILPDANWVKLITTTQQKRNRYKEDYLWYKEDTTSLYLDSMRHYMAYLEESNDLWLEIHEMETYRDSLETYLMNEMSQPARNRLAGSYTSTLQLDSLEEALEKLNQTTRYLDSLKKRNHEIKEW